LFSRKRSYYSSHSIDSIELSKQKRRQLFEQQIKEREEQEALEKAVNSKKENPKTPEQLVEEKSSENYHSTNYHYFISTSECDKDQRPVSPCESLLTAKASLLESLEKRAHDLNLVILQPSLVASSSLSSSNASNDSNFATTVLSDEIQEKSMYSDIHQNIIYKPFH
jgi:hypothetical protein